MTNRVENFLLCTECETREMLFEIILEYKDLRGLKESDYVPMGLKFGETTMHRINIDYDNSFEDGNVSFKYSRSGKDKIPFTIGNMIQMIEKINELNKPYRVLKKYREKSNEKLVYVIVKYDNYNPTSAEYTIDGWTLEEIFIKMYKKNRTYRYCNGCYYKFKLDEIEKNFCQWEKDLPHDMSMDLYYGNGIVD